MLFAGKTTSGHHLWPWWWCFLFGGNYRQDNGGYAWTPGVWRLTRRYYREKWSKAGYTWAQFVGLKTRRYGPSLLRNAYKTWLIHKDALSILENWGTIQNTRQAGCAQTGGPNSLNGNQVAPDCSESHPTDEWSDAK